MLSVRCLGALSSPTPRNGRARSRCAKPMGSVDQGVALGGTSRAAHRPKGTLRDRRPQLLKAEANPQVSLRGQDTGKAASPGDGNPPGKTSPHTLLP